MKHIFSIIAIIVVFSAGVINCQAGRNYGSLNVDTFGKDGSYALGMNIGESLKADDIYPDMDDFIQGIMDVLTDSATRFSMDDAYPIFQEAYDRLQSSRNLMAAQQEHDFLAENSTRPGIIITESGLQYEVIYEGTGERPTIEDSVLVNYEGSLIDGNVFDSSSFGDEDDPVEIALGDFSLPGITEGIQLMTIGSTYRFYIPSNLGFDSDMMGMSQFPPHSTLIYNIELVDIINSQDE